MKNENGGFTLTEIMIVVAVIGVLAGIGTLMVSKAMHNGRVKVAEAELQMIATGTLQMAWDTGKWPNGASRTARASGRNEIRNLFGSALFEIGEDDEYPDWKGPYYEGSLKDPWGNSYFFDSDYEVRGINRVVVGSGGPNRSGINTYDEDNVWVALDDRIPQTSEEANR